MVQRDLIQDQIEQMGKVISRLMSKFLDLKAVGDPVEAVQITSAALVSEADIDVQAIVDMDEQTLLDYVSSKNLSESHLDQLANYLYEIGQLTREASDSASINRWSIAAKKMLEMAERKSETITFERINLKSKIEADLLQR